MSSQEANNQKQFNPFNNEFECNICYEYCYGDKMDCSTCSGAICNGCMAGLNENDNLRNKCVTCRSPLETIIQYQITHHYQRNLAFYDAAKRERVKQVTSFFRHERDDQMTINVRELEWYFDNVLPLHPKDNGRKKFWRGRRVVHEVLFPLTKAFNSIIQENRNPDKWKQGFRHRILCYHRNTEILEWTNKAVQISKVNKKSVLLKPSRTSSGDDDEMCNLVYNGIDNKKRYKPLYNTDKWSPNYMMGASMGQTIILHKSHNNMYFYFINTLL